MFRLGFEPGFSGMFLSEPLVFTLLFLMHSKVVEVLYLFRFDARHYQRPVRCIKSYSLLLI